MLTIRQPDFSLAALIDPNDTNQIFSEPREMLALWSRSIENAVIEQELPAHVLVGFQHVSKIKPILRRYRELASIVDVLTVLGLPDSAIDLARSGIRYVTLSPDSELRHEWFLIVNHTHYTRALIAREVKGDPGNFHGILTSDLTQVERFFNALTDVITQESMQ